jgi:hypothetical protein
VKKLSLINKSFGNIDNLLELIYRSQHFYQTRIKKRDSSLLADGYPFLSCETYYVRTNFQINSQKDITEFQIWIQNRTIRSNLITIYVTTNLLDSFYTSLISINLKFSYLLVFESDVSIYSEQLRRFLKFFNKIYAVNLYNADNQIIALPLGLENQSWRSGGVLSDFNHSFSVNPKTRKHSFIIAWNDETNSKRFNVRRNLSDLDQALVVNQRVTPKLLHRLYRKTLFVPSPAGNGPDGHRTWEAIYCGAVPVAIKSTFAGDLSWPIFFIDDWSELFAFSRTELESIYVKYALTKEQSMNFSKKIMAPLMLGR